MTGARLARQTGVTRVNQWLNPLKRGTGSNLVDAGRVAVHAELIEGEATPIPGNVGRVGGHTECLRVGVAMLQGKSWAPILLTGTW